MATKIQNSNTIRIMDCQLVRIRHREAVFLLYLSVFGAKKRRSSLDDLRFFSACRLGAGWKNYRLANTRMARMAFSCIAFCAARATSWKKVTSWVSRSSFTALTPALDM